MSPSLGKPKEKLIKKICIRIMKFQSYEVYNVVFHNPPFKDPSNNSGNSEQGLEGL